ncbi:unnamed protein product [Mytilus coruscus]|uniref:Ig-like domain-containing protein n=1 Tax=Mytilus coruscus TaxID=42192 RepID=A0A6J8BP32_MYTCO|nr:unnamed protein product [Mytilus coruscus]
MSDDQTDVNRIPGGDKTMDVKKWILLISADGKAKSFKAIQECKIEQSSKYCVATSTGEVTYGAVGDIVVLPCRHNASAKEQRWRRDSTFLSFGLFINTNVLDNTRFKIIGDINKGEYNLQISNIRQEDFDTYWCEIQIKEHVSRTEVKLDHIERYPDVSTKQCSKKGTPGMHTNLDIMKHVSLLRLIINDA